MQTPSLTQDADTDILSCLARIEPGYVELTHPDLSVDYLFVLDFELAPDFVVSVGFARDRPMSDGDLGRPVFLHKRMTLRPLGTAESYLESPLLHTVLDSLPFRYPVEAGLLNLIRVVERVRSGQLPLAQAAAAVELYLDQSGPAN